MFICLAIIRLCLLVMSLGLFVIMSFIYLRTEAARSKQQNDNNLYIELKECY